MGKGRRRDRYAWEEEEKGREDGKGEEKGQICVGGREELSHYISGFRITLIER